MNQTLDFQKLPPYLRSNLWNTTFKFNMFKHFFLKPNKFPAETLGGKASNYIIVLNGFKNLSIGL